MVLTRTGEPAISGRRTPVGGQNDPPGPRIGLFDFPEPWAASSSPPLLSALQRYSTTISWSYYGDRCAEYLFGPKAIFWYRCVYIVLIVVGAIGGLKLIWNLADIFNALMAVPNLIGLIVLAGLVANQKRDYVRRLKAGDFDDNQGR